MYRFIAALLCVLVVMSAAGVSHAQEHRNDPLTLDYFIKNEPVLIVRYEHVLHAHFQKQVFDAAKRTVRQKPDAFFEILAIFPTTGDYNHDQGSMLEAFTAAKQITDYMQQIGIGSGQYRVRYTNKSGAKESQIRLYVR